MGTWAEIEQNELNIYLFILPTTDAFRNEALLCLGVSEADYRSEGRRL